MQENIHSITFRNHISTQGCPAKETRGRFRGCAGLVFTVALGTSACSEETDAPGEEQQEEEEELSVEYGVVGVLFAEAEVEGEAHEIPGVGRIQYGAGVRTLATVTFSGGGAVQFHESESQDGHGCTGFFPATSRGEPPTGRDGCLSTFLALTTQDTPVPAALLVGAEDRVDATSRAIVDRLGEPISAVELPLAGESRPAADGTHEDVSHSCTGDWGSEAHWETYHCDEGGADHCDPGWLDSPLAISSGHTYLGSYQTGLFCGNHAASASHRYFNNINQSSIAVYSWSHSAGSPSTAYIGWSTWVGSASWRRQIIADGGQYRHYTVMCPGVVCNTGV